MILKNSNKTLVYDTPKAKGFSLGHTAIGELVELIIEPEGSVPAHSLPFTVLFYIIDGTGLAIIDGISIEVTKGDSLSVAINSQREWQNNGTVVLRILAIKQVDLG